MWIKETRNTSITFEPADAAIIKRLVIEQVGSATVGEIVDNGGYMFGWFRALFTLLPKVCTGYYETYDPDEINVLVQLLSKAYNSETEQEKEAIKAIADAVDTIRNVTRTM